MTNESTNHESARHDPSAPFVPALWLRLLTYTQVRQEVMAGFYSLVLWASLAYTFSQLGPAWLVLVCQIMFVLQVITHVAAARRLYLASAPIRPFLHRDGRFKDVPPAPPPDPGLDVLDTAFAKMRIFLASADPGAEIQVTITIIKEGEPLPDNRFHTTILPISKGPH